MQDKDIIYNGFVIKVDEDGEIFLIHLSTMESLWLTELFGFGYTVFDTGIEVAKNWIDKVPHDMLLSLAHGQTERMNESANDDGEQHVCDKHKEEHKQKVS